MIFTIDRERQCRALGHVWLAMPTGTGYQCKRCKAEADASLELGERDKVVTIND